MNCGMPRFMLGCWFIYHPRAHVNARGKGFEGSCPLPKTGSFRLTKLATTIQQNGTKAILQIFSAGRMSSSAILRGQQPVSASAVAAPRPGMETPAELTDAEIEQTITDLRKRAGYSGWV